MAIIAQDDIIIRVKVEGEGAYPKLGKQSDNLGKTTTRLGRKMEQLGGIITGVDSVLSLASRTAAGFRAAIDAVSAPIGLAVDFEKSFAQIRTLSDEAGAELEQGLLDLAARVPQTAGDITKAAYQAISAGIDPGQTVDFLDAVSKTAVAGATDLTTATDLLTTAVNAYATRGLTAGRASDVLFATVRAGKTTIEELNASLGQSAPAAAQFGVSIEELGAATATLTKSGLSTSDAMTRINALIKAIINPSKSAAKQFKALGVEFGAQALEGKGLAGVLADIQEKTGGSSVALSTLFTRFEATQGLVGLLSGDMKTFNADLVAITDSAGSVARGNKIMADTAQGAIDQFKALAEGGLRDIGTAVVPQLTDGIEKLGTAMSGQSGQDIIDGLTLIVSAMVSIAGVGIDAAVGLAQFASSMTGMAQATEQAALAMRLFTGTATSAEQLADGVTDIASAFDAINSAQFGNRVTAEVETAWKAVDKYGDLMLGKLAALRNPFAANTPVVKTKDDPDPPKRAPIESLDQTLFGGIASAASALGGAPSAAIQGGGGFASAAITAQQANAERRAQLITDDTTRGLALLDLRHDLELDAARRAGEDVALLGEVQAAQAFALFEADAAQMAQRARDAQQADAGRRAMLIQDSTAREMELLRLRHEQELVMARQAGENINTLHKVQAQERAVITRQAAATERALWVDTTSAAVGTLTELIGTFEAVAGASQALQAAKLIARGIDLEGQAIGAGAEAFTAGAHGNVPQAIALGLAAVRLQAAAVTNFANAAKLGGSGGGGGGGGRPSGGGGGGGRAATPDAGISTRDQREVAPIVINVSGVIAADEQSADRFAAAIMPAFNRQMGSRGGQRFSQGR